MHGFPLDTAKALMRKLLGGLRPIDQFNVVLFAGGSHTLSPDGSLPASAREPRPGDGAARRAAGRRRAPSCWRACRPATASPGATGTSRARWWSSPTATWGSRPQTFRFIRERLAQANLFAFGIGTSVNRGLIEGMARAGQGEPFVVLRPEKAAAEAEQLRAYIEQPVLTAGVGQLPRLRRRPRSPPRSCPT